MSSQFPLDSNLFDFPFNFNCSDVNFPEEFNITEDWANSTYFQLDLGNEPNDKCASDIGNNISQSNNPLSNTLKRWCVYAADSPAISPRTIVKDEIVPIKEEDHRPTQKDEPVSVKKEQNENGFIEKEQPALTDENEFIKEEEQSTLKDENLFVKEEEPHTLSKSVHFKEPQSPTVKKDNYCSPGNCHTKKEKDMVLLDDSEIKQEDEFENQFQYSNDHMKLDSVNMKYSMNFSIPDYISEPRRRRGGGLKGSRRIKEEPENAGLHANNPGDNYEADEFQFDQSPKLENKEPLKLDDAFADPFLFDDKSPSLRGVEAQLASALAKHRQEMNKMTTISENDAVNNITQPVHALSPMFAFQENLVNASYNIQNVPVEPTIEISNYHYLTSSVGPAFFDQTDNCTNTTVSSGAYSGPTSAATSVTFSPIPGNLPMIGYKDDRLYDGKLPILVGKRTFRLTEMQLATLRFMLQVRMPPERVLPPKSQRLNKEPFYFPENLVQTEKGMEILRKYTLPFESIQDRRSNFKIPPPESYIVDGESYLGAEPTGTLYDPVFIRRLPTDYDNHGWCEVCGVWLQLRNHSYAHHFKSKHGVSQRTKSLVPLPKVIRGGEDGNMHHVQGYCEHCECWFDLHHRRRGDAIRWQSWYIHQFQAHHKDNKPNEAPRPFIGRDSPFLHLFEGYLT